ncbi:hypothetical protein JAAARDRAFT_62685 [Jaapia argillacea MUCL 33604]|uniref:Uncharacterized protein n=1 Tax=Jaapia argillacea MUCL 33604 TaxID=933084 RepID=A0A067PLF9_9AGAM|nr:hypothetical protein JAAARDRAFT_62685 [Jaapia argillacea MUCL 33604]
MDPGSGYMLGTEGRLKDLEYTHGYQDPTSFSLIELQFLLSSNPPFSIVEIYLPSSTSTSNSPSTHPSRTNFPTLSLPNPPPSSPPKTNHAQ